MYLVQIIRSRHRCGWVVAVLDSPVTFVCGGGMSPCVCHSYDASAMLPDMHLLPDLYHSVYLLPFMVRDPRPRYVAGVMCHGCDHGWMGSVVGAAHVMDRRSSPRFHTGFVFPFHRASHVAT